jgi:hypothetical protein
MKKLSALFIVIAILGLVGAKSSGKSATSGEPSEPYVVDLSTLTVVALDGTPIGGTVKNPKAFTKIYDDLLILFAPFPEDLDWSTHARLTTKVILYDGNGNELTPANGYAMVSLVYDITGNIRGPDMGPGPNTPLKEFNVGTASASVSSDEGARSRLNKAPQAILFQNSNDKVKFIEVTSIIFHK